MVKKIFSGLLSFLTDILETSLFAIAIFVVVYAFLIQPHRVRGDSMDPTLLDGQLLLTDKLSYRLETPQRGDIVVFKYPDAPQYEYIKRIIGLPGEMLEIKDSNLVIYSQDHPNGLVLREPYLPSTTLTMGNKAILGNSKVSIPPDKYVVLGDNRGQSSDSRTWGFVPKKNIVGKAWVVYWPPENLSFVARAEY